MKNTFVKVLSFLMALTMIVGMFGAMTISASAHTHTKGEQVGEPVPATCANFGYTLYKCATCGETYTDDIVPMTSEHTGVVEVEAAEATCTYPAMSAGQFCEDCNRWVSGKEAKPVKGSNPVGHKFQIVHSGSVCEATLVSVCTVCSLTFEQARQADKVNKNLIALQKAYPSIKWVDYAALEEDYAVKVVSTNPHVWEYEVKTANTKCEDGLVVRACKNCNAVEEIVLYAPHNYVKKDGTNNVFASCEEYVGRKCVDCGASETGVKNRAVAHTWADVTKFTTELQALGYTSKTFDVPATCTEDGYVVQQCSGCKEYRELTRRSNGHTWTSITRVDATEYTCVVGRGYSVVRECACGEVEVINTVASAGHILSKTPVYPTCTDEGYVVEKCIVYGCNYTNTTEYVAKLGHTWDDEYVTVSGGYDKNGVLNHSVDYVVTRKCLECGAYDENVTLVKATSDGKHAWSATATYRDATCAAKAALVLVCTVEDCTAFKYVDENRNDSPTPVTKGSYDKSNHDPAFLVDKNGVIKEATCASEGTVSKWCTNCSVDVTITVEKTAHKWGTTYDHGKDGKFNTANDKDFREKVATCTTPGQSEGKVCRTCGFVKRAPISYGKDPSNHINSKNEPVAGQSLLKNPVAANCQNGGWDEIYYSCCGATVKKYTRDDSGELAQTNPNNHINYTVYPSNPATCEEDGNHLYIVCDDCNEIVMKKSVVDYKNYNKNYTCCISAGHGTEGHVCTPCTAHTNSHLVPKTGHKGNIVDVEGLDEGCETAGYTAHQKYDICGCTIGKETILPHGLAYTGKLYDQFGGCADYTFVIVKPDGEDANGVYVYDCMYCFNRAGKAYISDYAKLTDTEKEAYDYWIVIPEGHEFIREAKDFGKHLPTFDLYTCKVCGATYTDNYKKAVADEHVFDAIKHKIAIKNNRIQLDGQYVAGKSVLGSNGLWTIELIPSEEKDALYACEYPTYTFQKCVYCDEIKIDETTFKAPVAHYSEETGKKVEITWSCTGFEASLNMTCEICNERVDEYDEISHNPYLTYKAATCTEVGYEFVVCTDCNIYLTRDGKQPTQTTPAYIKYVYPKYGHNPYDIGIKKDGNIVLGNTLTDGTLDGKADHTGTPTLPNALYATNASVKYVVESKAPTAYEDGYTTYLCTECDEIVTVVVPAINALDLVISAEDLIVNNGVATLNVAVSANNFTFNTITLKFGYDNDVLEFNAAALTYAGFEAADAVTVISKNNGDHATVNVYVPNGVDGLPKNAVINGEEVAFLTLTFKVLPTATDLDSDIIDIDEVKLLDAKYIENGEPTDMDAVARVEIDENVALTYLGDANADNRIDAGDSIAIMSLLYSGEYNVAADINGDGVVDLADHVALLTYNISYLRDWDYLAMMGVTIESVVADYNLAYDLNNDRAVNDTDKAMLVAATIKAIGSYEFYELDYATLEELVAAVADQLVKGEEVVLDLRYQ